MSEVPLSDRGNSIYDKNQNNGINKKRIIIQICIVLSVITFQVLYVRSLGTELASLRETVDTLQQSSQNHLIVELQEKTRHLEQMALLEKSSSSQQISELQKQVKNLQEHAAGNSVNDTHWNSLEKELKTTDEETSKDIAGLKQSDLTMNDRVRNLTESLVNVKGSLEDDVKAIEENDDQIEGFLKGNVSDLNMTINNFAGEQKKDNETLRHEDEVLRNNLNSTNNTLNYFRQRVDRDIEDLRTNQSSNSRTLSELALNSTITDINQNASIGKLSQSLESSETKLQSEIGKVSSTVDGLKKTTADLSSTDTSIQNSIDSVSGQVDDAKKKNSSQDEKLETIEASVTKLTSGNEEQDSSISDLETQVGEVATLKTSLNDLEARVKALEDAPAPETK